ncbi:MAG: hypothetical protein KY468_18595 [Armatimonadetes bacterium]|nr:hypothetical protein [Armatimonadota bacterium]
MRAVSLSNPEVITMLNRYYVPVYLSNEDYREGGAASAEEKAELRRIHREGHAAKLSVGTVHSFILGPDGRTLDSMHVAQAFKPELLSETLRRNAEALGTTPGAPVVPPSVQSRPPADPRSLTLHLTARYLERKGDDYALVENAGSNWSALPGEDWITLSREQWTGLLPKGKAAVGTTWTVDPSVARTLLSRFYPPTENSDVSKNRIERQAMKGTVIAVRDGIARARLEGSLKMTHSFYGKEDGRYVEADFLGYMEFRPGKGEVRSFHLVTDRAEYKEPEGRSLPYGVAVRTLRNP